MSRLPTLLALLPLLISHTLDAQTMRSDAGVTPGLLGFGTASLLIFGACGRAT